MGFRFRKSIKLLPGVRLNLSKSGLSASVGKPGATINLSQRGARTTVGVPGTGLSYSATRKAPAHPQQAQAGMGFAALLGWGVVLLFVGVVLFAWLVG